MVRQFIHNTVVMGVSDASVVLSTPIPNPSESGDVRGWMLFHEGLHRGQRYTADDCRAIAKNFQTLLKLGVKVKVQLGHDDKARFQLSLGYPCSGIVTRVWTEIQGGVCCVLGDVEHIPGPIAKAMKSKAYPDHSSDLLRNRVVKGVMLPGWSLLKLSLLGDEPPGIDGLPSPNVLLRQTTQQDRDAWTQAASFSESYDGGAKEPGEFTRIAFSELFMNRDQLLAQLKATHPQFDPNDAANMSDEELQQLLSIPPMTGKSAQFSAAFRKMFGMMPEAAPAGGMAGGGDDDMPPPPTDRAAYAAWYRSTVEKITNEARAKIGTVQAQGDLLSLVDSKAKDGAMTPRQASLARAIVADAGDERAMFSANAGALANTSKHAALREFFGSMSRNPMLDDLVPSGGTPATINGQDLNATEAMILAKLGIKDAAAT